MILNDDAKSLISILKNNNHQAYAVGGCVRDALLSREAGDIDITSSAKPEELEKLFDENGIHYIETGLKHGTITAIINHTPYEITTFRTDGEYADNRHPESVEFVSELKEDLARRDFTMNAIAYNDNEGYVDYFGGMEDIENGIIRCVGNADKRFNEDALRIMRAIRFASQLGFELEEETKNAVFRNKELLNNIAVERIFVELVKLLCGEYVERVLLEYREVIAVIIPEIEPCFDFHQNTKWHLYDVYTHIVKTVAVAPNKDYMRLAALFHDIGKPKCNTVDENGTDHFFGHPKESAEITNKILKRFKVSKELQNKIVKLVALHDEKISLRPSIIKKWLRALGKDFIFDFMDLKLADMKTHNLVYAQESIDLFEKIKCSIRQILDNDEPYMISQLKIDGNDLIELGYSGKAIAEELNRLIVLVSGQANLNNKAFLLKQAKKDLEI